MSFPEFSLPGSLSEWGQKPRIGLVLGSGLGGFVDSLENTVSVGYDDIDRLPVSGVEGHAGKLHVGMLAGEPIAIAQGRVHTYEGWSAREAASTVRLFHQLGAETVLLTNAAGIVNPDFQPGSWMMLNDHLNLARLSPLTGGPHFVDQTEVYSKTLREMLRARADEIGISLHDGVYAWVNGPEYETPAEIRMLRTLGADAVGMSTVPEAIQARALGMHVVALSCLTNYGAGMSGESLDHGEVMNVGKKAAASLHDLLVDVVPEMISQQD